MMGRGFLVSALLLNGAVGTLAVACMAALLLLAYVVGCAILHNPRHFEPIEQEHGTTQEIAFLSRIVLVGAYFISVTCYLQLLAALVLSIADVHDDWLAHEITSTLLLVISGIVMWRGLDELEQLETYALSRNLGMFDALLVALVTYNPLLVLHGQWTLPAVIKMSAPVGAELPTLLTVAAMGTKFSAAVADEEGAGGVLEDITGHNLNVRHAYLLLLLVTVTWETNVRRIVSYASRAFSLFYNTEVRGRLSGGQAAARPAMAHLASD